MDGDGAESKYGHQRGAGMVKAIALLKRKSGLSREEFVRHYEDVHAPLILKHLSTVRRYARNYVTTLVVTPPGAEEPDFDSITELWFDDIEGYKAMTRVRGSAAGKVIEDDEETFLDRSKLFFFLVDEKISKH
jgi:uncharacterized protein (TIGR02118 family)